MDVRLRRELTTCSTGHQEGDQLQNERVGRVREQSGSTQNYIPLGAFSLRWGGIGIYRGRMEF